MTARTKLDLGGETVRLVVPMRAKGSARWTLEERPVRYFPEIGETADDADAFRAAITASYIAWRRAEDARPAPIGYDATLAPTPHPETPAHNPSPADIAAWHAAQAARVPARGSSPSADELGRRAFASRCDHSPVCLPATVAIPAAETVTRKPRARRVAPAPQVVEVREAVQDRTYTEAVAAVTPEEATAPQPSPAELIAAKVRENAAECVTCGRSLAAVASHPNTGQCHPCWMAAMTPAPETHAYRFDDTIRHPGASRLDCADCFTQDAPVAPVLAAVPTTRERPTCERCGQTFRVGGSGYAWHVTNRPDCAARRLSVVA